MVSISDERGLKRKGVHTFVVSELARDADNAQLLGSNTGVLAKEPELVADLHNKDSVHVLPLDLKELYLHGRQLGLGALLLGRRRRRGLFLVSSFLIITIQRWSSSIIR